MEEYTQITLDEWTQWKEDIRRKLAETANNFVYIGYRLKQIRDSGMFGGAADVFEFAQNEYGLGKSTVSRFIAINEKYSEGGNSLELKEEFKSFSSSKLSEMLTLPDNEIQLITERTTVKEIRELKNFSRQQVSEEEDEKEERQFTPLQKCLVDYFKDKKDMLNAVIKAIYEDAEKEAVDLMNPSGYGTHKKGICFMFMYDYNTGVKTKLLTQAEPVTMTWKDVMTEIINIFGSLYEYGENDVHGAYYGEPEKEVEKTMESESQNVTESQEIQGVEGSVATSQQEAKAGERDEQNSPAAAVEEHTEEEQLPGQMSVSDYPELLPEGMKIGVKEANGDDNGEQESDDPAECDEVDGTTEDNDAVGQQDSEKDAWIEAKDAEDNLIRYFSLNFRKNLEKSSTEVVKYLYDEAINLAAALEKVLIARCRKHE